MCNSREVVDFTGPIKEITTKGFGQNSAEVVVSILNRADGEKKACVLRAFPMHEPQVFTAISGLLTAAYFNGSDVTISVQIIPNETPPIFQVHVSKI